MQPPLLPLKPRRAARTPPPPPRPRPPPPLSAPPPPPRGVISALLVADTRVAVVYFSGVVSASTTPYLGSRVSIILYKG